VAAHESAQGAVGGGAPLLPAPTRHLIPLNHHTLIHARWGVPLPQQRSLHHAERNPKSPHNNMINLGCVALVPGGMMVVRRVGMWIVTPEFPGRAPSSCR
jgi:hypothetical protein